MMLQFNRCIFAYDISYFDGEIFLISEEKMINDLNGNVFSLPPMEGEIFHFGKIGNFYWADNQYGKIFFYDSITNKIVYQNNKEEFKVSIGRSPVFIDSSRILVSRRVDDEKKISVINLNDFSFADVPYQGSYGCPQCNLVVDRVRDRDAKITFLIAYDTVAGVEKWRHAEFRGYVPPSSGEVKTESVRNILALVDKTLWVLLDTGRIVGLDPDTGECKKNIEIDDVDLVHFENAETDFINARGIGSSYVGVEEKVIYLSSNIYFEIDLTAEKPVRVCYNVKQTFKDNEVTGGGHQCVNSRYVFFNESMIGTIGAFDRQTKKVVWVDKLKNYKPDAGAVRELKATENQLYVHDNKQNLFVFDLI